MAKRARGGGSFINGAGRGRARIAPGDARGHVAVVLVVDHAPRIHKRFVLRVRRAEVRREAKSTNPGLCWPHAVKQRREVHGSSTVSVAPR
eukprot:14208317-Heterocapsa_arctica.AAC.1